MAGAVEYRRHRRARQLWSLWEMLKLNGEALHEVAFMLTRLSNTFFVHVEGKPGPDDPLIQTEYGPEVIKNFEVQLPWLRQGLRLLGAELADRRADELEQIVKNRSVTHNGLSQACADINRRLRDELS